MTEKTQDKLSFKLNELVKKDLQPFQQIPLKIERIHVRGVVEFKGVFATPSGLKKEKLLKKDVHRFHGLGVPIVDHNPLRDKP